MVPGTTVSWTTVTWAMPSRPAREGRRRGWSRLDRVNEALREVLAEELERVDDPRLELVTVTGVTIAADLRNAVVWFSALSRGADEEDVAEALSRHRVRLQAAVGRQLRLKRTPELTFKGDPAIAIGTRVEDILKDIGSRTPEPVDEDGPQVGGEDRG
jgi:ribosome-binding factor A